MSKKKKTHKPVEIMVVLDRSGSMTSILQETIGGFNAFLEDQKTEPGAANLSLLQFDNYQDLVHDGVPLPDVPDLDDKTFIPRGTTALYDAVASGIGRLKKRLNGARPLVVIMTDGQENASQEVSADTLKKEIQRLETAEDWGFIFLGANQDAILASAQFGINANRSATYAATDAGTRAAFDGASNLVSSYRGGAAGQSLGFDAQTRSAMADDAGTGSVARPSGDWLTPPEAAQKAGISSSTLTRLRKAGDGPPATRVGKRALRYSRTDLDGWLDQRKE